MLFFACLDENPKLLEIRRKLWNFLMKIQLKITIFYFYFRKFVTVNGALGNKTIFLHQLFRFRCWGHLFTFQPGFALPKIEQILQEFLFFWKNLKSWSFLDGNYKASEILD